MLGGIIQSRTSCQIDLLFKSKLAHKVTSFGVGILPRWVRDLTRPWRGILRWVGLVGDTTSCDDGVLVDKLRVCGVRKLHRHVSIWSTVEIVAQQTGAPKLPLLEKSSVS
jgi:hypothetical protein